MSKQPDKELRAELYELLKSDKRADTYVIPNRVMDIFVEYFTKAQLQLVDELMGQAVEVSTIQYNYENGDKMVGGFTNSAVPIPVLQQYKANLSGKGE